MNPTDKAALVAAARTSATPTARWCRSPATAPGARRSGRRISRGCSSTSTPQGPAARHAARRVVRLPHQPGDLVLGHAPRSASKMARFPFVVAFAYTRDETNHFADMLLPDATDLESLQLIRIGGTKYIEQFWDHEGFALRQPAVDDARRGARLHRHRHRAGAAHRAPRAVQRRDQPRRGRRAAEGRAWRLLARHRPRPHARSRSGTRCAARPAPS